jgi:hypothetical protein
MAFTDQHWTKAIQAIGFKIEDLGPGFLSNGGLLDFEGMLRIVRENWDLLGDERSLDVFLKSRELESLKAKQKENQATMDDLAAKIARLEG